LFVDLDDNWKRSFYEIECIRGNWSVRELRRQINSLYYERSGLSNDKSLDDSTGYDLSPAQETEIQHRLKMVRAGAASERPAAEVFADIRARYP